MAEPQSDNLYHRILKLPPHITEPDAYELLGLPRFEPDPIKVKQAAMDRTRLLQRKQNAEKYEDVKRIEREVGEAMVLLSHPERKADYDQKLASAVSLREPPPIPVDPPAQVTQSLRTASESTAEVKIPPAPIAPVPPPAERPPRPASDVPKVPPPPVRKAPEPQTPNPIPQADAVNIVPGEAPWGSLSEWWQTRPPTVKAAIFGAPVLMFLLLLIVWPSSSAEDESEPVAAEETNLDPSRSPAAAIDPASLKSLRSQLLFREESGGLEDIVMAPDGRWIATLGIDGVPRLWDKNTGTARRLDLMAAPGEKTPQVLSLAATPDGNSLYASTSDGQLLEWTFSGSTPNGPQQHALDSLANRELHSLNVTGDGRHVVGLDGSSQLVAFNRETNQLTTLKPFVFNALPSNVLAAPAESNRLAVFCSDKTIRLWNPEDSANEPELLLDRSAARPELALAYAPDGSRLALAGADHRIRLADVNDTAKPLLELAGHTDRIYSLSFSPAGSVLASAGADQTVRLWNVESGTEITQQGGHEQPILSVAFSQTGDAIYTASLDGIVRRWSPAGTVVPPTPVVPANPSFRRSQNPQVIAASVANKLSVTREFTLAGANSTALGGYASAASQAGSAVISPDGLHLARRESSGQIALYDTQTGRRRYHLPATTLTSMPVRFSPDGRTLLMLQSDRQISSWDVTTGRLLDRVAHPVASYSANPLAVAAKGNRFVVSEGSSRLRVHTGFEDFSNFASIPLSRQCEAACLSPDGRFLASYGGNEIEIWDVGDPAAAPAPNRTSSISLPYLYRSVAELALSPDGETCAVGLRTGQIQIYSTTARQEVASFTAHSGGLHSLAFNEQGTLLLTAGSDSGVALWNAAAWGAPLAQLLKPGSVPSLQPAPPNSFTPYAPSTSSSTDPVVAFQLTEDSRQLVVLHQTGSGVVWEVGAAVNAAIAGSGTPADLKISGPPQVLGLDNIAAASLWSTCTAHAHGMTHMAFSPDQEFLITAGRDGSLRVWSADSGELHHVVSLSSSAPALPSGIPAGRFGSGAGGFALPGSPMLNPPLSAVGFKHMAVSSKNLLAATEDGGTIRLWDVSTGASRGAFGNSMQHHDWFDFSPDGDLLILRTGLQVLEFWDLRIRKLLATVNVSAGISAADASPANGPYMLATADGAGEILLWKSPTQKTPLQRKGPPVSGLTFSPDGKRLAFWDQAGEVQIFDLETNTPLVTHRWASFVPSQMQFTSDSDAVFVLSSSGQLRGLPTDPAKLGLADSITKTTNANLFALSPDGKMLALAHTGTTNPNLNPGTFEVWGVGEKPANMSASPTYSQTPLVTASTKPFIHPDAITRERVTTIAELGSIAAHTGAIWSLDFLPDGSALVSGGSDKLACIWDAFSRNKLQTLSGHTNRVLAVAASPDNQHIATASNDGIIKLWDRNTGKELASKIGHKEGILDLAFSPTGIHLATGSQDRTIKVFFARSLTEQNKLTGHTNSVTGVAWLADTELLSAGSDNKLRVWNPLGGQTGTEPGHGTAIEGVAVTRGRKIAFASKRGTVGLWTSQLGWTRLSGHKDAVRAVAFSPDETLLVSASSDLMLKFWDADTGKLLHTVAGSEKQLHCLCFSPDGRWLIVGDAEGVIKIWGLPQAP